MHLGGGADGAVLPSPLSSGGGPFHFPPSVSHSLSAPSPSSSPLSALSSMHYAKTPKTPRNICFGGKVLDEEESRCGAEAGDVVWCVVVLLL